MEGIFKSRTDLTPVCFPMRLYTVEPKYPIAKVTVTKLDEGALLEVDFANGYYAPTEFASFDGLLNSLANRENLKHPYPIEVNLKPYPDFKTARESEISK